MATGKESLLPAMVAVSGTPHEPPATPIRKITIVVLAAIALVFGLLTTIERLAPPFSRAVVQAYVVRIAPNVGGRIIQVDVTDNDYVEAGRVLFRIDARAYQISAIEAQAEVERIGQALGLSTASLERALAMFVKARGDLENIKPHAQRVLDLVQHGILPKPKGDAAQAALVAVRAMATAAEAELTNAWKNLGPRGGVNLDLIAAVATLERASIDLVRTTVTAPAAGLVSDLQLAVGQFVAAHQASLTLIDPSSIWISARFSNEGGGRIAISDQAEVVFDASPGLVFTAEVKDISEGGSANSVNSNSRSLSIKGERGADTPHSDVRLILTDRHPRATRFGSRADVVVYTHRSPMANAIGHAWIRITSVLNYVR
jgi:multidrug resistance efflux pump